MFKSTLIFLSLFTASVNADEFNVSQYLNKTYITIGAGYKFMESIKRYSRNTTDYSVYGPVQETTQTYDSSPISARIEIGYQYSKSVKFGISHHSQWLTGWPINDDKEYSKTELFIDYTFYLGE